MISARPRSLAGPLLVALMAFTACQSGYRSSSPPISHSLLVENFTLSARAPVRKELGLRLVSVALNRTVTIELLDGHRRFSAKPGRAFVSEKFGQSGLVLESASPSEQTAALSRTFCATSVGR